jgi:hypothetical protein
LYWEFVWLCLAALAAGAVNSIAGGGTLLTFPALLAGLSSQGAADAAVVANASRTVALVPGSLAGARGYRCDMKRARRWLYLLGGGHAAGGPFPPTTDLSFARFFFPLLQPMFGMLGQPPWNSPSFDILIAIPAAYDGAELDSFYIALPYTFNEGQHPRVNGPTLAIDGRQWQMVSWHYPDDKHWRRGLDTLESHIAHCKGFFLNRGSVNAY